MAPWLFATGNIRTAPGSHPITTIMRLPPDASPDQLHQAGVSAVTEADDLSSYDDYAEAYRQQMDADPAKDVHRIDGGPGLFRIGFNDMAMVQIYSGSSMVQVSTFDHEERHALELARRVVARLK